MAKAESRLLCRTQAEARSKAHGRGPTEMCAVCLVGIGVSPGLLPMHEARTCTYSCRSRPILVQTKRGDEPRHKSLLPPTEQQYHARWGRFLLTSPSVQSLACANGHFKAPEVQKNHRNVVFAIFLETMLKFARHRGSPKCDTPTVMAFEPLAS